MVKTIRRILITFFVCAVVINSTAQNKDVLKDACIRPTSFLNRYIAYMAAPSNSEDTRFGYKKEAQDLFINKCNDYTEIVEFENGEKKPYIVVAQLYK